MTVEGAELMKTAVLTTVYKGVEDYFKAFVESLKAQTYKDFKLIVLNDGMTDLDRFLLNSGLYYHVINIDSNCSPTQVREKGIRLCIDNNFEALIFADSDDVLHCTRVQRCLDLLADNDIALSNMALIDEAGSILGEHFFNELNQKNIGFSHIIDSNYFGLTNTAVKAHILDKVLPIPEDIIAVDWWIFSVLSYWSSRIAFIPEDLIYYRQHAANLIGAGKLLDINRIKRGVEVKLRHYNRLSAYFKLIGNSELSILFKEKYCTFNKIRNIILPDPGLAAKYMAYIEQNRVQSSAWWADILEYKNQEE